MYDFDPIYLLYLFVPVMVLALVVQLILMATYAKYSEIQSRCGLTGAEAARRILELGGVRGVSVTDASWLLGDHYSPSLEDVKLFPQNYEGRSITALAVAAHEASHALQDAQGYKPFLIRSVAVPAANFGFILGHIAFFAGLAAQSTPVALVGFASLCGILALQLINLPVEFDASRRALELLSQSGILTAEESEGAQKVMGAAALTYVGVMIAIPFKLLAAMPAGRRFRHLE